MLEVRFQLVKPDQVERVRAWMAELQRRESEVQETFAQERMRAEKAWLVHTPGGTILAYAMDADDIDHAYAAARASQLPLDAEHTAVMRDIDAGPLEVELVWDMVATWEAPRPS